MNEICALSAVELLAAYRDRSLSPVQAVEAVLARIEVCDDAVNAFVLVDAERALAGARESETRWLRGTPLGRLDGVPVSIKDLNDVAGWPTRCGSRTSSAAAATRDEPAVRRMREHGAVFIGKTTTPEFGWKAVTDSPLTGITRNPWNRRLTPGGSSGGAAVAAALGMGALHLGGDGGGSIRIPAAFTGVFGLKPSFGRVPKYPQRSPVGLTQSGPLTRTVADAALMLTVISEPDPRDWLALPHEQRDYVAGIEDGIAGLRIAWSPRLGYADVDPEIAALTEAAALRFAELGARLVAADPGFACPLETFIAHWQAGQLLRWDAMTAAQRQQLDPGLAAFAAAAEGVSLRAFARAAQERVRLGETMMRLFIDHDLLLTPALPIAAFAAGCDLADPASQRHWMEWTPFTYPFNLTGQPAAVCPCGFTAAGLPVGLQIVGPLRNEALVLRAARAFERLQAFKMPTLATCSELSARTGDP